MPPKAAAAAPTPLTANATRWGQQPAQNTGIFPRHCTALGRSGLSPSLPEGPPLPAHQLREFRYQARRFEGWTAQELVDLEANGHFSPGTRVLPANLDNEIHPVFARGSWAQSSVRALPYGNIGTWTAADPIVWTAMEPSLRLASKILSCAHEHPWFQDLLFGTTINMPAPPRAAAAPQRRQLLPMTAAQRAAVNPTKARFQAQLMAVAARRRFIIANNTKSLGITRRPTEQGIVRASIHSFYFEALLPGGGLTPEETLITQFNLAVTLLHELCHVIARGRWKSEPWYAQETLRELGYSMENALFGGTIQGLPSVVHPSISRRPRVGHASLAIFVEGWVSYFDIHRTLQDPKYAARVPIIAANAGRPAAGDWVAGWTMPFIHVQDMFQNEWWRVMKPAFGIQNMLMDYARVVVRRRTCNGTDADGKLLPSSPAYYEGVDFVNYMAGPLNAFPATMVNAPGDSRGVKKRKARKRMAYKIAERVDEILALGDSRFGNALMPFAPGTVFP